jgi:hypothetical protein
MPYKNITKTNSEIFLSDKNIYYMRYVLVSLNRMNKSSKDINILYNSIPKIMIEWAKKNNIDNSEYITYDITKMIKYMNITFLKYFDNMYMKSDQINVFRKQYSITDEYGKELNKKHCELLASDYHTMNLWDDGRIFKTNNDFRYKNILPLWQTSTHTRNYDLSNDGLRASDIETASLNNQVHGYNMSNIIKGINQHENDYLYTTL